jgi:hypothetical protein
LNLPAAAAKVAGGEGDRIGRRESVEWRPDHLEALYANVYARRLECPACGAPLAFTPSGDVGVAGTAACPRCAARHVVCLENDPLRNTFRDFTDAERRRMRATEPSGRPLACPVDGTAMDVHLQRSLGRTSNVIVRCRRCTRTAEFARTCG